MAIQTSSFYRVDDIKNILGVSKSKAYKIIQQLNKELKEKGYITIAGRIPIKYFKEKYYC
ncbi:transcriptional regulator [Clostridium sp. JS66]|uniref:transcriptional regulator n=1 Tax=Clostridium sp. JS66 TaxID=3064705 RepID=UPI00298E4B42|nr:transcriptional regulator [Clostridium sp. JS66]WPC42788.1 transcriptional regulator [Clostridium sp. JS66]